MTEFKWLDFQPIWGLSSKHLQTILPVFRFKENNPPSFPWAVDLGDGDQLVCEVSTPQDFCASKRTVMLIHGLGGSHESNYMVRLTKEIIAKGLGVIRINLRGCGSGQGKSKSPYYAGCSADILKVLQSYKQENKESKVILIGFSLGANVALKLLGELESSANDWIETCFAICSPIDLKKTVLAIGKKRHYFYEQYYLKRLRKRTARPFRTLYEFDQIVTAPAWGFKDVEDYYTQCSSQKFLPHIRCPTHLLFAVDDPFVDVALLNSLKLPPAVHVWLTKHGGHMGFLGRNAEAYRSYWMDQLILRWLDGDFISDLLP